MKIVEKNDVRLFFFNAVGYRYLNVTNQTFIFFAVYRSGHDVVSSITIQKFEKQLPLFSSWPRPLGVMQWFSTVMFSGPLLFRGGDHGLCADTVVIKTIILLYSKS